MQEWTSFYLSQREFLMEVPSLELGWPSILVHDAAKMPVHDIPSFLVGGGGNPVWPLEKQESSSPRLIVPWLQNLPIKLTLSEHHSEAATIAPTVFPPPFFWFSDAHGLSLCPQTIPPPFFLGPQTILPPPLFFCPPPNRGKIGKNPGRSLRDRKAPKKKKTAKHKKL